MLRRLPLLTLLLCTSLPACESNTDDGETGATPDERLDFEPVTCGEMTCDQGLLCVMPSESCDYTLMPPDWVQPALECAALPDACADLSGTDLDDCLWESFCASNSEHEPGMTIFANGTVDCPHIGLDCFE